jgi:hypothetical protein
VDRGCGIKAPLGSRAHIVERLAMAIRFYDGDRAALARDGTKARERVLEQYDWDKKGMQMEERYQRAAAAEQEKPVAKWGQFGFARSAGFLNLLFSLRGVLTACAGLILIGALFFLSLGYLKKQAESIVIDTLPGLSYAGEANATLSQAFNRTLLLLLSGSPEQRAELEKDIQTFSDRTTALLEAYKGQIFSAKDQAIYDRVLARRKDYLRIREETVKYVNANQMEAAAAQCKSELLPAFKAYKGEADKLFAYNIETGRSSGESIMRICSGTQILVAVIGVLIFVAGFLIGISR